MRNHLRIAKFIILFLNLVFPLQTNLPTFQGGGVGMDGLKKAIMDGLLCAMGIISNRVGLILDVQEIFAQGNCN
jgi:hypothetical protein